MSLYTAAAVAIVALCATCVRGRLRRSTGARRTRSGDRMTYIGEKANKTLHELREALGDATADLRPCLEIDWDHVDEEVLVKALPLIDSLGSHKQNLGLLKLVLMVLPKIVVEEEPS